MDSLNVPLPPAVHRQLEAARPHLASFEAVRETPTLVVKRFDGAVPAAAVESEVRLALADASRFDVSLDGIGTFEAPVTGPAPVVYLAVDSPGLERVHARLVEAFGAVDGLEGPDYVPHVTLARGGGGGPAIERLDGLEVDRVEWTVSELWFWDARRDERVGRVGLDG